ncbi:MAG: DUF89 domain-containing protein [Promethearchaeota archaeon]
MRMHLDCIPCFQRQALQAVRFVTEDENQQQQILRKVMMALYKLDWRKTPPEIARVVHKIVKEETKQQDPYSQVKKENNDVALKLYPSMKNLVNKSKDPLLTAIRIAIAGNIIDFGAKESFNITETIEKVLVTPFKINTYSKFVEILSNSQVLTYLGDNAGEIVFDKLLLETILEQFEIKNIQFAVKGGPIINDATIEDAEYVKLTSVPNIKFIKIEIGLPGIGLARRDEKFLEIIKKSDVVVSKGQGNYEALSDQEKIFFLLLAKCPVLARDLGVDVGDIVFKG